MSGTIKEMMRVVTQQKTTGRVNEDKLATEGQHMQQDQQLQSDNLPMPPSRASIKLTNYPGEICECRRQYGESSSKLQRFKTFEGETSAGCRESAHESRSMK